MRGRCQIVYSDTRSIPGDFLTLTRALPDCKFTELVQVCISPMLNSQQSYTVYVAATIHVRIAAQRGAASEASRLLSTCLQALNENAATNPGVGKMYAVICGVMTRLGVNIPAANNANPVGECKFGRDDLRVVYELIRSDTNEEVPNEPIPEDVDISAVIRRVLDARKILLLMLNLLSSCGQIVWL